MSGWRVEHDGMRPETWWSLRRPDGSVFVWAHFQKGEELREIAAMLNAREALLAENRRLHEILPDIKGLQNGSLVRDLRRRIEELEAALRRLGAIADMSHDRPTCAACQRQVEKVRSSLWHGDDRICHECFHQWYDPDSAEVDPTDRRSLGNYIRKKHGLEPLP